MYQDVFIEALLNMIAPVFVEVTALAMRGFGGYDMLFVTALAALGGSIGALLMWSAGHVCCRMARHPSINFAPEERYEVMHERLHRYGIWLLLLVCLPVGFAMAFVAGFFNIPLRIAMPLMMLSMVGYYASVLL